MTSILTRWILGGDFGANQTLGRMRQLVNQSLVDPVVIETARSIVENAGCFGRNEVCKYMAIREWMEEHLQFLPDPYGVELLATPRYLLDQIRTRQYVSGDCDDTSILGAALGKAVGMKARFVAMGFGRPGAAFKHVTTHLLVGGKWVSLDTTRSQRFPPPAPSRVQTLVV